MASVSDDNNNNIAQELPTERICATCPKWFYQMGAHLIEFKLLGFIEFYHLFVLVINRSSGQAFVARGGPSGNYGKLVQRVTSWENSLEAKGPGLTFRDLEESDINRVNEIVQESQRIHDLKLDYAPTGPNSNSFAMSVARGADLPAKSPVVRAPGKGMKL